MLIDEDMHMEHIYRTHGFMCHIQDVLSLNKIAMKATHSQQESGKNTRSSWRDSPTRGTTSELGSTKLRASQEYLVMGDQNIIC